MQATELNYEARDKELLTVTIWEGSYLPNEAGTVTSSYLPNEEGTTMSLYLPKWSDGIKRRQTQGYKKGRTRTQIVSLFPFLLCT